MLDQTSNSLLGASLLCAITSLLIGLTGQSSVRPAIESLSDLRAGILGEDRICGPFEACDKITQDTEACTYCDGASGSRVCSEQEEETCNQGTNRCGAKVECTTSKSSVRSGESSSSTSPATDEPMGRRADLRTT